MSDVELKPCPFCGGVANRRRNPYHEWIECIDCTANISDGGYGIDIAERKWNRRAAPPPDEREALADAIAHNAQQAVAELESRYDSGESWDTGDALLSSLLAYIQDCARRLQEVDGE